MQVRVLENLRTIRLGQGGISKNVVAFVAIELGLTVFSFATHSETVRLIDLSLMAAAYPIYLLGNFLLLRWFPAQALLEGSHYVDYVRTQQGLMGAPAVLDILPATTNPERPAPDALLPGDN